MKTMLLAVLLVCPMWAQINYPDFATAPLLDRNGSTALNAGILQLTPNLTGQAGSAYEIAPFPVTAGFDMAFTFRMSPAGGADGFAFVIQNDLNNGTSALGTGGGEMGYGADAVAAPLTAISNALVIEFDTYRNGADSSDNEISVHTNGTGEVTADEALSIGRVTPGPDLNDGAIHTVRVVYTSGLLDIYLDDLTTPVLSTFFDFALGGNFITSALFSGGLTTLPGGGMYVGFTAGTGAIRQAHEILSWQSGPYGWQANSPEATLTIGGAVSNGLTGPGTVQVCAGDPTPVVMDSTLVGSPFDVGLQLTTMVPANLTTPAGQFLNLDLTGGGVFWLNSPGVLPNFLTPFPGTISLPFTTPTTPVVIGSQLVILDPAHPDSIRFSQGAQIDSAVPGGSLTGPTGDDSAVAFTFQGLPLCAPNDMSFFGTTYSQFWVNSNGRVTFGGADTDFSASVAEALTDNPFIGCWVDFNPGGGPAIQVRLDAATQDVVVDYGTAAVPLPYFSLGGANSFEVRMSTLAGTLSLGGLGGIGNNTRSAFLGISGGNAVGATDPGPVSYATLAGSTTTATDMTYEFATPGPTGGLSIAGPPQVSTILFIPNGFTNYDFLAF